MSSDINFLPSFIHNLPVSTTYPVILGVFDSELNCTFVSESWLNLRGSTACEESGKGWLQGIHEADQDGIISLLKSFQTEPKDYISFPCRLLNSNNGLQWLRFRAVSHYDSKGILVCLVLSGAELIAGEDNLGTAGKQQDPDRGNKMNTGATVPNIWSQAVEAPFIKCQNKEAYPKEDYTKDILSARKEERELIAQEIHDALGQYLTSLKINVGMLLRGNLKLLDLTYMQRELQQIYDAVERCIEETQFAVSHLKVPQIDESTLLSHLSVLFNFVEYKLGLNVIRTLDVAEVALDAKAAFHIFRIMQEAVHNIIKHSNASDVAFSVTMLEGKRYCFTVKDNGRGIRRNAKHAKLGFGMQGMQERAGKINAICTVANNTPTGTVIQLIVPGNF